MLTPKEIVEFLDKYIIGQGYAKRAVAIALRNRYRRQRIEDRALQREILPKNIIMIGPTGVGKTEIARRLAELDDAPFIKVEATKFTEVGYVGRDVESMIRDLVSIAVSKYKKKKMQEVEDRATWKAKERVLDAFFPGKNSSRDFFAGIFDTLKGVDDSNRTHTVDSNDDGYEIAKKREQLRKELEAGRLDDREIEIEVETNTTPFIEVFSNVGLEEIGMNMKSMLGNILPRKTKKRRVKVKEALELLKTEEAQKLIDEDEVISEALKRVENNGIVFIDEIDKIVSKGAHNSHSPNVSREGVQRDLLPLVEGTTVNTRYGTVRTHHILFIAAGAFHGIKPSDLIPELQGRFPIRVELDSLSEEDFFKILKFPKNALTSQYEALLKVDSIDITFSDDGLREIARIAREANERMENIGARRLYTVMERLLENISFEAPDTDVNRLVINQEYVQRQLRDIVRDEDLSKYIL